jgi:hypothetical protein
MSSIKIKKEYVDELCICWYYQSFKLLHMLYLHGSFCYAVCSICLDFHFGPTDIKKLSWNRSSERPVKSDRESKGSGILEKDGRSY